MGKAASGASGRTVVSEIRTLGGAWGPSSYLYDTGATVGMLALNNQGHGGWRGRSFPQSEFEFTEKQEQEAIFLERSLVTHI